MVSIHDTQKYHNYMYNLETQKFIMIDDSILDFLRNKEPHYYKQVLDNFSLKTKLNGSKEFTLFIPINNTEVDLSHYLFVGSILLDDTKKLIQTVDNDKSYTVNINNLDNHSIKVPNIRCRGGIIHLFNL